MESEIRRNLNRIIRNLDDDGKLDFDSVAFKILDSEIERENEIFLEILMETIRRSGCPDRLIILQLLDHFFVKYVHLRDQILNDPEELLELLVETNPIHNALPGSKIQGNQLKLESVRVIKNWEKLFAKHDARMKCVAVTLKKTKFVDYDGLDVKFEAERQRMERIADRRRIMMENTKNVLKSKFLEIKKEADRTALELDSCLKILVPSFTDDVDPDVPSTSSTKIPSNSQNLEIILENLIPEISVTSENDALIEAFLDAKTLLVHRVQTLRKLVKRIQQLKFASGKLAQTIIDYRDDLKKLILKAEDLKIVGNPTSRVTNQKKSKKFDDDFIDVEISIDDILMVQYSKETEEAIEKEEKEVEKVEKSEKKKKKSIKTVPFGLDLKYWGEDREQVQVPKNNADCHRFWRSADEGTVSGTAQQNIYTQRQFTFIGEAPKSDKVCRAKLPNGSLCPRRDFHSCPLHGKIVARDEKGQALSESDREITRKIEETRRKKETEYYSRKIEKEMEKVSKKRKRKHEVDTTHSEDVRERLQKKLFDPKAVQRVSAVLDASRKNRLEKNFGQQFSHL